MYVCLTVNVCSVDPFSKKDWYDIKSPNTFTQRSLGKTLVTRTAGTKVSLSCAGAAPLVEEFRFEIVRKCGA